MASTDFRSLGAVLKEFGPLALVWTCLAVLPFGRTVEVSVLLMATGGLVLSCVNLKAVVREPRVRLFTAVFLVAWLPIAISWFDAVRPDDTLRIVANHWRFYFSGLFILFALRTPRQHRVFLLLCAATIAVWVVDALVQWGFDANLLGYGRLAGRVNGIFGSGGLLLGIALSVFAALLIEGARRTWPRWIGGLLVAGLVLVVLIAGSRASWIGLMVLALAYLGVATWKLARFPWRPVCAALVTTAAVLATLYATSPWFETRLNSSFNVLSGQGDPVHDPVRHRFWIWDVALRTFQANPVTGVGARGFRHAYDTYTPDNDPYLAMSPPQRPTHPHQLWFELLAETGSIGAMGILVLHGILIIAFVRASPMARATAGPFGLCLLVAYFPINTHLALFSAFWSQIVWWLLALFCAGIAMRNDASEPESPPDSPSGRPLPT